MIQINGVNVDTQQFSGTAPQVSDTQQQLSEAARQAIGQIPRAKDWLVQMGADTSETYSFPDEAGLVDGVSLGLTSSSLLYLAPSDVLVAVRPFLACGAEERSRLSNYGQALDEAPPITSRLNWATQSELLSVGPFLEQYGLDQTPFLNALDLQSKIELLGLSRSWMDGSEEQSGLRKKAATFAAGQARRAREFVEYCRAYELLMSEQEANDTTYDLVAKTISRLQEGVFSQLRSAATGPTPSAQSVLAAVCAFVDQGNHFGFSSLASGVLQLVRDAGYRMGSTLSPDVLAKGHLERANSFVRSRAALSETWAQHGLSAFYAAREGVQTATVRWDAESGITLASYTATPQVR